MSFFARTLIQGIWLTMFLVLPASSLLSAEEVRWIRTPDVVYVGTPYDLISKMLKMARVKKSDLVYDLGCGDARMLILAAQKYGSKGRGYDIDPERVKASRENVAKNKVDHLVKIYQADIFTIELKEADVIPLYLLPEMNTRLLPQLEKLKPGSRIVCHQYQLEGIVPDETVTVTSYEDHASHTLYLYTTPLKRGATLPKGSDTALK